MNDRTLPFPLRITAAQTRLRAAKDAFTRISVDVLRGREGSEERVRIVLDELAAARLELAAVNAEQHED